MAKKKGNLSLAQYFPKLNYVVKVWGSELWIANFDYCGKLLKLKKDFRCSMHYHRKKNETFYIQSGKVLIEWCAVGESMRRKVFKKGEILQVPPLTIHRFTGLEDSEIFEFSTHHEDSDSYRFIDSGKV